MFDFDDERDTKRTLGIRDKQILYERAKHKCERCGKEISFIEMQSGHNIAWSKGGKTTLKNSLCLCYACNKLQGTDTKKTLLKKLGVEDPKDVNKRKLEDLSLSQLKQLAKSKDIKVKSRVEEGLFESTNIAPSKKQYINKLKGVVSDADITNIKTAPVTPKKKRRQARDDSWF